MEPREAWPEKNGDVTLPAEVPTKVATALGSTHEAKPMKRVDTQTAMREAANLGTSLVAQYHTSTDKFLFHSSSAFIRHMDMSTTLALLFVATFTPYEIAFMETPCGSALFWWNRIIDFLFIFDMLISRFWPHGPAGEVTVSRSWTL